MKPYVSIGCLLVAWLPVAGCGSRQEPAAAPEAGQQTTAATGAITDAGPQEGTMTTAPQAQVDPAPGVSASPGKPRAPVEASIAGTPALQSGVPGKVMLEVRPGVAVDGLTVEVAGDAALTVVGQELFRFGPLAAGEPVRIEISVTPTSGGIGRLTALLTLETGGQRQARPVTLALEIGGPVTLQVQCREAGRPAGPGRDGRNRPFDAGRNDGGQAVGVRRSQTPDGVRLQTSGVRLRLSGV